MPLINHAHSPVVAVSPDEPTFATSSADLASPQPDVRRGAARQLGHYPEAAGLLCSAVAVEERECVREAIFTALIRLGTRTAAEGLVPLLGSEDVGLRNGAIEALANMPDAAAACVCESLKSGTRDVRIFGAVILGALAHPDSPACLIRAIEEDADLNVCATAVNGLTECGNDDAVVPLRALLERFPDEPYLQFSVQTALTRIAGA